MKNLRHATTILLFAGLTSCMPGKFASGIEGVIVDSQSSNPIQGAIIESSIPHRNGNNGAAFSATTSDQNGRFSFRPVYGIYKLLMMSADWRELTITKNGYEKSSVSVFQRDSVRIIETGGRTNRITTPRSEELKLSIKKK
jgi:hypothetical protein